MHCQSLQMQAAWHAKVLISQDKLGECEETFHEADKCRSDFTGELAVIDCSRLKLHV